MRARDIMSSPVVTVGPATSVRDAAATMLSNGFTALPVVDGDERLVGMVTEADLVRDRFRRDPRSLIHGDGSAGTAPVADTVGEVMSSPASAMGPGADIAVLTAALLESGQRAMPIVDATRVVGIVTRRDLVRVVARADDVIATDVGHKLGVYGGRRRWQVDVHAGVVSITGEFDDETDRHVAVALAEAVPGVLRAQADPA